MKKWFLVLFSLLLGLVGCSGSLDQPREVPASVFAKISGKLMPGMLTSSPLEGLFVEVVNGSEWCLTDVDVSFARKRDHVIQRFRFHRTHIATKRDEQGAVVVVKERKSFLEPYCTDSFDGEMGGFLAGIKTSDEYSWFFSGARGFKP